MIIFCEHAVETLTYFSREMAECFAEWGYEVFFLDFDRLGGSVSLMRERLGADGKPGTLITFNFIGLSREAQLWDVHTGQSVWEELGIRCLNIMVDHPAYYHKQLGEPVRTMTDTFCVDRDHVDYMRRFYPQIRCGFLPLAGNMLPGKNTGQPEAALLPGSAGDAESGQLCKFDDWMRRKYPLVFTANYVPLAHVERQLNGLDQEYRDFYYEMLTALMEQPDQNLLSVMEYYIKREIPQATDAELCEAMSSLPVIDLWIRTYFREKTVKILADGGIPVRLFGKDWEMVGCRHPENLIFNGKMVGSADCVKVMSDSYIALNTMPWFKSGAHDRIFTAMLQQTVSLTDGSGWLRERFPDGDALVYYDLKELERLPELVRGLLKEPERMYAIACRGFDAALREHTWRERARTLLDYI